MEKDSQSDYETHNSEGVFENDGVFESDRYFESDQVLEFGDTAGPTPVADHIVEWMPMGPAPEYATVPPKEECLSKAEQRSIAKRLEDIEPISPVEMEQRLLQCGYRGQPVARRAGAILAYRHLMRLRRRFLEDEREDAGQSASREHYLFLGTTGSGKTYLTELLFREIIQVPTLVADMTRFSETGYVGDDVQMLISQLYEVAGHDRAWASCGVICIDEFDKLAANRSASRFGGEGTSRDVSGMGVQRGLLTLLSGSSTTFTCEGGFGAHTPQQTMPLDNVLFIACGAFSGLQGLSQSENSGAHVGFGRPAAEKTDDRIAAQIANTLLEETTAFSQYGLLPELVGRFSRLVAFQPLTKDDLRSILDDSLLNQYRMEFRAESVELVIDDAVLDHVVETALRRETGARGLRASLVPHLEEAAFVTFGQPGNQVARLRLLDGAVQVET